jgi:hypothetical protein
MKLYHGSKRDIILIERRQAGKADSVVVPETELQNAIYLTPDYGFALACGARPNGVTTIDNDNKTINFENPDLFDSNARVFVYEVDAGNISKENIEQIDERQFVVSNMESLSFENKFVHKAGDVQKYYELNNWKEKPRDTNMGFKIR